MTTGAVTVDLEAIIRLVVAGTGEQQRQIEAVIDTGFSGYLTLPTSVVNSLQLVWLGREQGILADGRVELFDVYRATVIWDGLPRAVEVEAAETEPLLGMSLLAGHEVRIRVVAGGEVTIAALT